MMNDYQSLKGMKMKKLKIVVLMSTALFFSQAVMAEHAGGHDEKNANKHHVKKADTNNDGVVSRDEFMAKHQEHANKRFEKLDANKDGNIDDAEHKAARDHMKEHRRKAEKVH